MATWPRFHCFVHQYGRRDVKCKRSIVSGSIKENIYIILMFVVWCHISFTYRVSDPSVAQLWWHSHQI